MPEATHEDIEQIDLFWISENLWWRIKLKNGFITEVADSELRFWLGSVGEKNTDKISYRKFAKYAKFKQKSVYKSKEATMGLRKRKIECLERYFLEELAEDKNGGGSDFDREVLQRLSVLKELYKDDPYEDDLKRDIERAESEGM